MAEPLDSTPHGARSWTPEQIPPLARRLWLLFWLTAAQALAALLTFFSPTQSFSYRLGELLQAATLLGGGLALLGLSRVLRAYRWAGLCSLAAGAVGGLTLLEKSVFHSDFHGEGYYIVIFPLGEFSIYFRICRQISVGRVLAHYTDIYIVFVGIIKVFYDIFAVFGHGRQYKVAHDHSLFHKSVRIKCRSSRLPEHLF